MHIRLLVACHDENPAAALCAQLAQAFAGQIVAEACAMAALPRKAAVTQPDVLLLEHTTGEEEQSWLMLSRLRQVSAATRVLLLCEGYTRSSIIGSIQRGASGCLLRSSEPSLYAKAVRKVHEGETWFGRKELLEALRSLVIGAPIETGRVLEDQELLTAREREILALIGSAMSNKEIARQLNISDLTVKTHLHHIYVKLEKSGRYKAFLSKPPAVPGIAAVPRAPSRGLQPDGAAGT